MPELTTYFQAGGLIDGVINQGLPAPIDIQIGSNDMDGAYALAQQMAAKIRTMPNVASIYIPQSINYPGLELNIDREKASLIGLSAKDVVDNVITAMTSDGMIAPSYWIDPSTGNNYMVTVQYANRWINNMSMEDFGNIPLRGAQPCRLQPHRRGRKGRSRFGPSSQFFRGDHRRATFRSAKWPTFSRSTRPPKSITMQIRRVIDIYVATRTEALQAVGARINQLLATPRTTATRCFTCAARWST